MTGVHSLIQGDQYHISRINKACERRLIMQPIALPCAVITYYGKIRRKLKLTQCKALVKDNLSGLSKKQITHEYESTSTESQTKYYGRFISQQLLYVLIMRMCKLIPRSHFKFLDFFASKLGLRS